MTSVKPRLYVVVDGADMDRALGEILRRKPQPNERPRWGRVLEFARKQWPDRDVKGLFLLRKPQRWSDNINRFSEAITALGFRAEPFDDVKQKIDEILRKLTERSGDVILLSHQDYREVLTDLVDGQRIVGVIAFPELLGHNDEYKEAGIRVFDFERDALAFEHALTARHVYTGDVSVESFFDDDW